MGWAEIWCQLPLSVPGDSRGQRLALPAMTWDSKPRELATKDARPSLGVQGFCWKLATYTYMADYHVAALDLGKGNRGQERTYLRGLRGWL